MKKRGVSTFKVSSAQQFSNLIRTSQVCPEETGSNKNSGSSHKTSYSKTSSVSSSQVKRTSSESSGADDVLALIRNELNQERWLQEAIKENIESCDNSMSSLNDVMDDEETQKLREGLPPDLDDYIGHSRLLRKYSLDLATDSQPLAQSGYVGLRVVGGKNLNNRMLAKVLTVRLGSPADLLTSVKPGDLIISWNDQLVIEKTFEETQAIISDYRKHTTFVVAYQINSQNIDWSVASRQQSFQCSAQVLRRAIMSRRANFGPQPKRRGSCDALSIEDRDPFCAGVLLTRPPVEINSSPSPTTQQKITALPHQPGMETNRGTILLRMHYKPFKDSLYVTVVRAEDLPSKEKGELCNPYVKLCLLPRHSGSRKRKTKVKNKTLNPIYDDIFKFSEINRDQVGKIALEVTVWNYDRFAANEFLGEVLIDLCDADLSGKAYWYPLYVQHTPPETHLQPSAAVKRIVNQIKQTNRAHTRRWTTFGNKSVSVDTSSDNTSLCEMQVLTNAESDSDLSYRTLRYIHSTSCDSAGTSSYWHSRSSVDSRLSASRSSWSPSIDSNYTSYGTSRYDSRSTSLDSRMSLGSILFYSGDVEDEIEDSSGGRNSAMLSASSLKHNLQRHLQYSQFGIKDKNLPVTGFVQIRLQFESDQLMVTAISAKGLIPRDKMGSAEPYLKLYLHPDRSKRKTRVMTRTLNPEWNQQFVFPGVSSTELKNHYLEIIALHYDRFSCSSFMGQAIIFLTLDVCDGIARWHDLSDFKSSRDLLSPAYSIKPGIGPVSKSTSYLPASPKPQPLTRPCYSEGKLKLVPDLSPRMAPRLSKSFDPLPDFSNRTRRLSMSSQGSLPSIQIKPYCSQGALVTQPIDPTDFMQSSSLVGLSHHQPLEPILSAQSVESSQENSVKQLDDSSNGDRKSSDGQGEACKVFPHDSGAEASGSKVLSPLQIFKKLFTPKSVLLAGRKKRGSSCGDDMISSGSSEIDKHEDQVKMTKSKERQGTRSLTSIFSSKTFSIDDNAVDIPAINERRSTKSSVDIVYQDRRSTKSSIESDCVRMTARPPPEGHDKGTVLDVIGIGPGQNPGLWRPPGFSEQQATGEVQVSMEVCNGTLRLTVIRAKQLRWRTAERAVDTYVKAFLLDSNSCRKLQKKRSKVAKNSLTPTYNEVFSFEAVYHDKVLAMTVVSRERFARKQALGEAQINLASLDLTVRLTAWYRLFSSHPQIPNST
ncbi:hypothetical protein ACHWQZ_G017712 [Mnemiopsis leidyi]